MSATMGEFEFGPTMSVEEAAALFDLSRSSGYRACERGEIPVIRIGRRLRVPTAKVLEMLGIELDVSAKARPEILDEAGTSAV